MCELPAAAAAEGEDQNSTARQEPNCSLVPLTTKDRKGRIITCLESSCWMAEESDFQTQVSHAPRKFTGTLNIGLKPDGSVEGEEEEEAREEVHGP